MKIQQIGPTSASLQALRAGRLGMGILSAPFKWAAADEGLTRLGVQSTEISPQWPKPDGSGGDYPNGTWDQPENRYPFAAYFAPVA